MADEWRALWRLYRVYARMDLLWFLRDLRYCLLQMAADLVSAAACVSGIFLLAARFDGLGGMSQPEVLFLLGYATLVDGVYMLLFANNNAGQISRVIGRGQLDHCMLQPVPLWVQLLACGFAPVSGCSLLLCGAGVTAWAAAWGGLRVNALLLALCALCSCAVIVSVVYLISCLAFYAPVAAEEIAMEARGLFGEMKGYPLGGLPGAFQALLCTLAPVALTGWAPVRLLLGQAAPIGWLMLPLSAATAIVLMCCAFRKGLRYYATCGCSRYSGFGHR